MTRERIEELVAWHEKMVDFHKPHPVKVDLHRDTAAALRELLRLRKACEFPLDNLDGTTGGVRVAKESLDAALAPEAAQAGDEDE